MLQYDRIINADTQLICMYDIIQECDNSSRHQNLRKRQNKDDSFAVNLLR